MVEVVESKSAGEVMALWRQYFDLLEKLTPEERAAFPLTMRHLAAPVMFVKPGDEEIAKAMMRAKPGEIIVIRDPPVVRNAP